MNNVLAQYAIIINAAFQFAHAISRLTNYMQRTQPNLFRQPTTTITTTTSFLIFPSFTDYTPQCNQTRPASLQYTEKYLLPQTSQPRRAREKPRQRPPEDVSAEIEAKSHRRRGRRYNWLSRGPRYIAREGKARARYRFRAPAIIT